MAGIEVYGDIGCPFTHVSLRKVVELRGAMGRPEVAIRVLPWPLELVNGHPIDAALVAREISDIRAQVAPSMFAGFDPARYPSTTLDALALVEVAYEAGPAEGERASLALRDAVFERGLDVGEPAVLASLAAELGLKEPAPAHKAAVITQWHAGQRRGVKGSPHFFCGETDAFCPALEISHSETGGFRVGDRHEVLEAFLSGCLRTA